MKIIAADVGGTKTHLVYADLGQPAAMLNETIYASNSFDSFETMLASFIDDCDTAVHTEGLPIEALTLALPGVVDESETRLTNLPWVVNKQKLKDEFDIDDVHFINDFQASALGTLQLGEADIITLHEGTRETVHQAGAIRVIVGAGTGLGVSWIEQTESGYCSHATEGGHIDFAAADEEQAELAGFLRTRYDHVSYERLLSGSGLVLLHEFVSGQAETGIDAAWVNQQAASGDAHAMHAVSLFTRIYAAFIGNLAMLYMPHGGIYITGGMAAKMSTQMQSEEFINTYLDKGRMQQTVGRYAVHLVLNENVGVLGAVSATRNRNEGNYQ